MEETTGLVVIMSILPFVAIIVFFVQASNVAKIKKELEQIRKCIAPQIGDHEFLANREKYQGNVKEAIKHWKNLRYHCEPYVRRKTPSPYWKEIYEKAGAKIRELGGEI